jgi:hypothetical protein
VVSAKQNILCRRIMAVTNFSKRSQSRIVVAHLRDVLVMIIPAR